MHQTEIGTHAMSGISPLCSSPRLKCPTLVSSSASTRASSDARMSHSRIRPATRTKENPLSIRIITQTPKPKEGPIKLTIIPARHQHRLRRRSVRIRPRHHRHAKVERQSLVPMTAVPHRAQGLSPPPLVPNVSDVVVAGARPEHAVRAERRR